MVATATGGGWKLSATSAAGLLRVRVTAAAGRLLPNYCGGPDFVLVYVNSRGVTVAAPPQPLPQYCLAGGAPSQSFAFAVPRAPGFYTVHVIVREQTGIGTSRPVAIAPTLEIAVSASGLEPLS